MRSRLRWLLAARATDRIGGAGLAVGVALLSACALDRSPILPSDGTDAGIDAAQCREELCNGSDDDCDGRADEGFDLAGDPRNCGACGNVCPSGPAGRAVCASSSCDLECGAGLADCDGDPTTGCEASLTDPRSCGACGIVCAAPAPLCADDGAGVRCVDSCPSGTEPCGATCAALERDVRHCGGCDNACPSPAGTSPMCDAGRCAITCPPDLGDCDGVLENGCETSLRTLGDCGGCGLACAFPNASATCSTGTCERGSCDGGFADCDGDVSNGCERDARTLSDCGGCDVACAPPAATASCASGTCAITACDPDREDCNGDISDGCEIDVRSDRTHCGACGSSCGSGESCVDRRCARGTDVVEVSAGSNFSCARLADGRVYCWGGNGNGRLGDGSTTQRTSAVAVVGVTDAVSVSAGTEHACAVRAGGEVVCWGRNNRSQVGVTGGDQSSPVAAAGVTDAVHVAAGHEHTCAVRRSGAVACWGRNDQGQLGSTGGDTVTARDVAGLADAVRVGSGDDHGCARRSTGELACWGRDNSGQLGDGAATTGSTTPVTVATISDAVHLGNGPNHACAVRAGGTVACWGLNASGQLGDGGTANATSPVAVMGLSDARSVSAGAQHTCALRAGGGVACWGFNNAGRLGDGTTSDSRTPVDAMGLSNATDVSAGGSHTCSAGLDGTASCWGSNANGQLGDGSTTGSSAPVAVTGLP